MSILKHPFVLNLRNTNYSILYIFKIPFWTLIDCQNEA